MPVRNVVIVNGSTPVITPTLPPQASIVFDPWFDSERA